MLKVITELTASCIAKWTWSSYCILL